VSVLDKVPDSPKKRWLAQNLDHADKEFCLIFPFPLATCGYGQITDGHIPHRLMCEHRHGPAPTEAHQAAHSCGKGHLGCVNQWHLNWRTPAENQVERYEQSGLVSRAKLTRDQVDEILEARGREVPKWTAQRFGVSEANIRQLQAGKTWKTGSIRARPLSAEEVLLIRATPRDEKTARQLATEFGVSRAVIEHVRCGATYKWVVSDQASHDGKERT
jgi:hypothetical protein